MSAAESLRLARIEAGLNLRDAARMHQMTPRRLSNLENEREEPTQTLKEQMHRRYGYVGESTAAELARARNTGKLIFLTHPLQRVDGARMMCRFLGCHDPTIGGPCALCYE